MKRISIPSSGPLDWRSCLVDKNKHWKRGRSAFETAFSWEMAQKGKGCSGLPSEVSNILNRVDCLKNSELLLAIPEHQVRLNNHRAPSHNDVWALLKNEHGLISLTIEAKAGESFDQTVTSWLNKDKKRDGRVKRLDWICDRLKTDSNESAVGLVRYQLLHRTVSALLEAERFGAFASVMLVQAFPGAEVSLTDFKSFGSYFGMEVGENCLVQAPKHQRPSLFVGWVSSGCSTDAQIASTLERQG
jgi:hypothetical protein